MNDRTVSSLADANRKGQIRKDAAVQREGKKYNNARRDTKSGLSSSNSLSNSSTNGSILNSINRINNNNIKSNLSSSVNRNSEAKKRINRQNIINNTKKLAEMVPIAKKAAEVEKLTEKVKNAKRKKSGMFGRLFGQADNEPTNAEIKDAKAAQVKGEEYNPADTKMKFTGGLEKREKRVLIGVLVGILSSNIIVCIILISAITGGGKESYLASDNRVDTATESDIEKAYNKDEESETTQGSDSNNGSESND